MTKKIKLALIAATIAYFSANSLAAKGPIEQNRLNTKLVVAIENKSLSGTQDAINNGAQVNMFSNGVSPLYKAAIIGSTEIVELLLNANADINAGVKENGTTPLWGAVRTNHIQIVKLLLEAKAKVDGISGETPLTRASFSSDNSIVAMLLEAGADVNAASKDGTTPLLMACIMGRPSTVRILLDSGADANAANNDGDTPLLMASKKGSRGTVMVKYLLAAGADANAANKAGHTPLGIASGNGYDDTVKILLKHTNNISASEKSNNIEANAILRNVYDTHENKLWDKAKETNTFLSYVAYTRCAMFGEHYDAAVEIIRKLISNNKPAIEQFDRITFTREAAISQGEMMERRYRKDSDVPANSRYFGIKKRLKSISSSSKKYTEAQLDFIFASWCEATPVPSDPEYPIAHMLKFRGIADGKGGWKELTSLTFDVHLIQKGGASPFCPIYIYAKIEKRGDSNETFAVTEEETGRIHFLNINTQPLVTGLFCPTGSKPEPDFMAIKIDGFVLAPNSELVGSHFYASSKENQLMNIPNWKSKTVLPENSKWFPAPEGQVLLLEIVEHGGILHLKVVP